MTSLTISIDDIPSLEGRTAIVTGGSSGIGLSTVNILASKGAKAYILDVNPPDEALLPNVEFIKCNVTSWREICTAFKLVKHVDIAVANAGVCEHDDDYLKDKFDDEGQLLEPRYEVVEVNYRSVLNFVKLSVRLMRESGGGSIIITSSATAYAPEQSLSEYSSTKAALIGLMRALRSTLPLYNITINSVAPAATNTKILPPNLAAPLIAAGIPISSPDVVGLAVAYSATARQNRRVQPYGKDSNEEKPGPWNGRTIMTMGNTYTELEEPIANLRPQWFGQDNVHLTRMQQTVTDFRGFSS